MHQSIVNGEVVREGWGDRERGRGKGQGGEGRARGRGTLIMEQVALSRLYKAL